MLRNAVAILALSACATPDQTVPTGSATLYIIQRDWHTDIGLPTGEITPPLAALEQGFPGVRFLTFGFGERQYLVRRHQDFAGMVRAMLPSESVLLVTALKDPPAAAFGADNVVTLHVPPDTLTRIQAAIWRELELDPSAQPRRLDTGPYPGSAYYAARDTYDGLFTCNTWVAGTLQQAGLPVPGGLMLFSGQVMTAVRQMQAEQPAGPNGK